MSYYSINPDSALFDFFIIALYNTVRASESYDVRYIPGEGIPESLKTRHRFIQAGHGRLHVVPLEVSRMGKSQVKGGSHSAFYCRL